MKKVLIVSTVARQFYLFEKYNIPLLKSLGYEVHCAANNKISDMEEVDKLNINYHFISIERNPFSLKNIKAYLELKKLVKNNKFEFIHCHSPVGGVLTRLVAKKFNIKVIYTAHGFHFFKGAPLINWLLFYPVEKYLSKYTDILITINQEDYERAQTFYAKKVEYIPGVGIDTKKIKNIAVDKKKKREELGLTEDKIVLLSVGELNKNKNHSIVIKALAKIDNPNIYYLICGQGNLKEELISLIKKLNLEKNVKLLGFRKDIYELCKISDIFVFPSKREGLSVALMEAICCNLPIICSDIRGNNDLIEREINGFLVKNSVEEYGEKINFLIKDKEFHKNLKIINRNILNKMDKKNIELKMIDVYKNV